MDGPSTFTYDPSKASNLTTTLAVTPDVTRDQTDVVTKTTVVTAAFRQWRAEALACPNLATETYKELAMTWQDDKFSAAVLEYLFAKQWVSLWALLDADTLLDADSDSEPRQRDSTSDSDSDNDNDKSATVINGANGHHRHDNFDSETIAAERSDGAGRLDGHTTQVHRPTTINLHNGPYRRRRRRCVNDPVMMRDVGMGRLEAVAGYSLQAGHVYISDLWQTLSCVGPGDQYDVVVDRATATAFTPSGVKIGQQIRVTTVDQLSRIRSTHDSREIILGLHAATKTAFMDIARGISKTKVLQRSRVQLAQHAAFIRELMRPVEPHITALYVTGPKSVQTLLLRHETDYIDGYPDGVYYGTTGSRVHNVAPRMEHVTPASPETIVDKLYQLALETPTGTPVTFRRMASHMRHFVNAKAPGWHQAVILETQDSTFESDRTTLSTTLIGDPFAITETQRERDLLTPYKRLPTDTNWFTVTEIQTVLGIATAEETLTWMLLVWQRLGLGRVAVRATGEVVLVDPLSLSWLDTITAEQEINPKSCDDQIKLWRMVAVAQDIYKNKMAFTPTTKANIEAAFKKRQASATSQHQRLKSQKPRNVLVVGGTEGMAEVHHGYLNDDDDDAEEANQARYSSLDDFKAYCLRHFSKTQRTGLDEVNHFARLRSLASQLLAPARIVITADCLLRELQGTARLTPKYEFVKHILTGDKLDLLHSAGRFRYHVPILSPMILCLYAVCDTRAKQRRVERHLKTLETYVQQAATRDMHIIERTLKLKQDLITRMKTLMSTTAAMTVPIPTPTSGKRRRDDSSRTVDTLPPPPPRTVNDARLLALLDPDTGRNQISTAATESHPAVDDLVTVDSWHHFATTEIRLIPVSELTLEATKDRLAGVRQLLAQYERRYTAANLLKDLDIAQDLLTLANPQTTGRVAHGLIEKLRTVQFDATTNQYGYPGGAVAYTRVDGSDVCQSTRNFATALARQVIAARGGGLGDAESPLQQTLVWVFTNNLATRVEEICHVTIRETLDQLMGTPRHRRRRRRRGRPRQPSDQASAATPDTRRSLLAPSTMSAMSTTQNIPTGVTKQGDPDWHMATSDSGISSLTHQGPPYRDASLNYHLQSLTHQETPNPATPKSEQASAMS